LAVASDCQPNKLPTVTAYNYRHNNGVDSWYWLVHAL
jgi:hypothetical protein